MFRRQKQDGAKLISLILIGEMFSWKANRVKMISFCTSLTPGVIIREFLKPSNEAGPLRARQE